MRCGDIPELGYGHLYRSIILANFLKKILFRQKNIVVIKTTKKYSKV